MGLIGDEGMLGATLALGVGASAQRGVVQGTGTALRMPAAQFRRDLSNHPRLARTLNRYVYVLVAQLSQNAACNRFHPVEARLARWLLMTHDRAHADEFRLTHQFLADMLGVRRGAVTIASGALQERRLTRYSHGRINIVSRKGLEAAACECYASGRDDYARLLT
jgi:CRP-like cAMP-binding protein